MRQTPIPLLRDLPHGCPIVRCPFCNELVMYRERCEAADEAKTCPSRSTIDNRPVLAEAAE